MPRSRWKNDGTFYLMRRVLQQHNALWRERLPGLTPVQFAVRWVLNNKLLTAAVAGPRTMEQWQGYLSALSVDFTAEDEALVDSLVPAGHPSTPGYSDPAYPLEGRVARTG